MPPPVTPNSIQQTEDSPNTSTMTVKLPFNINAGILDYNPSDKTVRPLYTKGLLTISKADSLDEDDDGMDILNFKWKPLDTVSKLIDILIDFQ